jgi:O-antigen ligase/polysaccharide polymerase Wzy-like membrane protein
VFLDGHNWRFFSEYGWIPYAWIVLCLTPDLKFASRNPLDTSISSTAPETYVQLLAYLLVAGLIILSRRGATAEDRGRLRLGTLLIWPLIALLSTAWSVVPLFTFVRASQLLVPIGLAFLMTRIWLSSPERGAAIWRDTLRIFVRVVTVLALIGFAAGFWKQRFTWPGAHPIVASLYMGLALLLLIACGRSFLHFRASGYVFRISLLAVGLYLGETRTVIAALLLALAVMFWWFGRTRPAVRFLGLFYYGLALVLLLVFALPGIVEYLARGETGQNLETLNGRIPLWEIAIDLVREAGRWFTGFGYGAARILLPTHVEWAGSAHSSWLELLLAIGIWGPLFGVIDIFSVLRHIPSRRAVADQALMMAMLAFLVVASIASETLVIPGLGFVILALLHVPILVERNSWGGADLRDGAAANRLPEAYGVGRAVPHP